MNGISRHRHGRAVMSLSPLWIKLHLSCHLQFVHALYSPPGFPRCLSLSGLLFLQCRYTRVVLLGVTREFILDALVRIQRGTWPCYMRCDVRVELP
jgi:hypothetical protein